MSFLSTAITKLKQGAIRFFTRILPGVLARSGKRIATFVRQTVPGVDKEKFRFRHFYMVFFLLAVIGLNILADPRFGFIQELQGGASTVATLILSTRVVIYVALLFISCYALYDYVERSEFFEKAKESPTGAGLALIAISITYLAIAWLIQTAAVA